MEFYRHTQGQGCSKFISHQANSLSLMKAKETTKASNKNKHSLLTCSTHDISSQSISIVITATSA